MYDMRYDWFYKSSRMFRTVSSNTVACGHMWLLKFKLSKEALATFQGFSSHIGLVATVLDGTGRYNFHKRRSSSGQCWSKKKKKPNS